MILKVDVRLPHRFAKVSPNHPVKRTWITDVSTIFTDRGILIRESTR